MLIEAILVAVAALPLKVPFIVPVTSKSVFIFTLPIPLQSKFILPLLLVEDIELPSILILSTLSSVAGVVLPI